MFEDMVEQVLSVFAQLNVVHVLPRNDCESRRRVVRPEEAVLPPEVGAATSRAGLYRFLTGLNRA